MNSSHSEIDRLMAEADDIIAFGVTIGIDPDDDTEEAQERLALAWEQHCARLAVEQAVRELSDESSEPAANGR